MRQLDYIDLDVALQHTALAGRVPRCFAVMHKLIEVETAKALLAEASEWSIWKWLLEKRRVREIADRGTEALDRVEKKVKAGWSAELRKTYREAGREDSNGIDPKLRAALRRVKEADEIADDARLDAEATFDEAERRLSADMAREGALKAITAYELREKAIRKAESVGRPRETQ